MRLQLPPVAQTDTGNGGRQVFIRKCGACFQSGVFCTEGCDSLQSGGSLSE